MEVKMVHNNNTPAVMTPHTKNDVQSWIQMKNNGACSLLIVDWGQALSLPQGSGTFSFVSATANLLLMEYPDPFLPLPKTRDKVQKTISYFILLL